MDPVFITFDSFLRSVYNFMKAGLIHSSRRCPLCTMKMTLQFKRQFPNKYEMDQNFYFSKSFQDMLNWVCIICWSRVDITSSSILRGYTIVSFDLTIKFWIHFPGAQIKTIRNMLSARTDMSMIRNALRNSMAHYW